MFSILTFILAFVPPCLTTSRTAAKPQKRALQISPWQGSQGLAVTRRIMMQERGEQRSAGGANSAAAAANAPGEHFTPVASPDAAGGAGKRRRCGDADAAGEGGASRKKARSRCPHDRERSQCKECGGASICPHQRERSRCKECGGAGICQHQRRRSECKECGGAGICPHQRIRSQCKECRTEANESMPDGLEELREPSHRAAAGRDEQCTNSTD